MKMLTDMFQHFGLIRLFLTEVGLPLRALLVPTLLSIISTVMDGVCLVLFWPTLKGLLESNYDFVIHLPILSKIILLFPSHLVESGQFILFFLITLIFLTAIIKNISSYFSTLFAASISSQIINGIRKRVFAQYLQFGKLYFDNNPMGRLFNILIPFTNSIESGILTINLGIASFFQVVVFLSIMAMISTKLLLVVLVLAFLFTFFSNWIIGKVSKNSKQQVEIRNALSKKILNTLSCILVVKANLKQEEEKAQFAVDSNNLQRLSFDMVKKQSLIPPVRDLTLLGITLLLVVSLGVFLANNMIYDMAACFLFIYLFRRAWISFQSIDQVRIALAQLSGTINEIRAVFDNSDKAIIKTGEKIFKGLNNKIEIRGLSFGYKLEKNVLKDINLEIPKGKMTAIVGPSGSGKTTFLHLLLRFYDCAPGTILIDDEDIRSFDIQSLMRSIGFVSQDINLFNMSLRANIEYGAQGHLTTEEINDCLKIARLDKFILDLPNGLETEIGDRGVILSGGEKQRLTLARALAKKAEILILDEATSSLDSQTESLIQEAISETIKGRTTLVVAHRLSTIKEADLIIVFDEGRVVEKGTLQQLLDRKGVFFRLWEEQKFF